MSTIERDYKLPSEVGAVDGDPLAARDFMVALRNASPGDKSAFVDEMLAYYATHGHLKGSFLDEESGDACIEGSSVAVLKAKSLTDEAPTIFHRALGIPWAPQVLANAVLNDLRIMLATEAGNPLPSDVESPEGHTMTEADWANWNPIPAFNDAPSTDKAVVIAKLQKLKEQYHADAVREAMAATGA